MKLSFSRSDRRRAMIAAVAAALAALFAAALIGVFDHTAQAKVSHHRHVGHHAARTTSASTAADTESPAGTDPDGAAGPNDQSGNQSGPNDATTPDTGPGSSANESGSSDGPGAPDHQCPPACSLGETG